MSQREELEEQGHRRDGQARPGGTGGLCCSQGFLSLCQDRHRARSSADQSHKHLSGTPGDCLLNFRDRNLPVLEHLQSGGVGPHGADAQLSCELPGRWALVFWCFHPLSGD